MEATYLGDIELTDETLQHYGVKGMKWRHRKGTTQSAMGNDPRYQKGYIVKPGEERARLDKLNPAGTRVKTTTTTKKTTSSSTTSSSSSSKKKGSGSSKKAVKDILSRFKLTKSSGGKSSSSTTKKESTGKKSSGSSEKKESSSSKKESSGSKSEEKTATKQEPQVIEKTRVSEDYTRYLERQLGKANYSKLQNETIQDRIKTTDAQKKRKARGVRKIYTRS